MTTKFDIINAPGYNDFLASVQHLQPDTTFRKDKLSDEELSALVKIEKRKEVLLKAATEAFIESLNDSQ